MMLAEVMAGVVGWIAVLSAIGLLLARRVQVHVPCPAPLVAVVSAWTHAQCRECWDDPDMAQAQGRVPGQEPVVFVTAEPERCCFCGGITVDGIYVRCDPALTLCAGDHDGYKPAGPEPRL